MTGSGQDRPSIVERARGLRSYTVEVAPSEPSELIRAGGTGGGRGEAHYLWAQHDVILLASGSALPLPLVPGWAGPASGELVEQVLGAVATVGGSSGRDGTGPADGTAVGVGPVALGALPYDPGVPGQLVIPRLVLCQRGSRAWACLLYTSPSPRDPKTSRMPSSA